MAAESTTAFENFSGYCLFVLHTVYLTIFTVYVNLRTVLKALFPRPSKSLKDEVILVTGGGNGIGRELCLAIAKQEKLLTIVTWDMNEASNIETAKYLTAMGVRRVHAMTVDISNKDQIAEAAARVKGEVGDVSILFNNAGIAGTVGEAWGRKPTQVEKVLDINVLGQIWTMNEFLPKMVEMNKGHIVQTCSCFSLMWGSTAAPYIASKYAMNGYLESLKEDLRLVAKTDRVKVTSVYPFHVATDMMAPFKIKLRYPFLNQVLTPQYVAERMVTSMRYNVEHLYLPGFIRFYLYFFTFSHPDVLRKSLDLAGSALLINNANYLKEPIKAN